MANNRIYTRTGDAGTTGIHGGARVPKDDPRIEANGDLDELNCQIGVVRAMMRCPVRPGMTEEVKPGMTEAFPTGWDFILYDIQKNLMTVMSLVATTAEGRGENPNRLPENLVADCEAAIDARRDFQIVRHFRQSADHPESVFFPEGLYLKGLLLRG